MAVLPIPVLEYVENGVDVKGIIRHSMQYWTVSVYASVLYLILVFWGRRWMEGRKPYDLRRPLLLWNVGLAAFSIVGTVCVVPSLLWNLYNFGVDYTVCFSDAPVVPRIALWCYVFGLSKLVELGDTAFIVLRKSPLPFLHWYHHITVFIYTFYSMGTPNAVGHFFSGMNYTVHSFMYTYYAFRAAGWRVPQWLAKCVTLMQLSQMFVGVYVTGLAFYNYKSGRVPGCYLQEHVFYLAAGMYFSYALLFLNFFYQKYFKPKQKTKKE